MSTTSPLAAHPVRIAVDNTVGAELIGILISVLLFGIFLMQVHIYIQTFVDDAKYLKYMVYVITLCTTVSTVFLCHGIYYYVVTNYANPLSLIHEVWSLNFVQVPTGIIISTVQGFFITRVYRLSGYQKKFVVVLALLSLISNGVRFYAVIEAAIHPNETGGHIARNQRIPSVISFATIALGDCVIAVLQTYYLHKGRSGVKQTNHIINTLIAYSVSTGVITSITAFLGFSFFVAMPDNTIFWAFASVSSGTYSNALLASLNGRRKFISETPVSNTIAITSLDVRVRSQSDNQSLVEEALNSTKGTSQASEISPVDESTRFRIERKHATTV